MCLAIPGKVIETYEQGGMHMAKVQFGGVVRETCLEYVPETKVGEYVLVHVGFAISTIDEEEAQRTYEALAELGQLSELEDGQMEEEVHDAAGGTMPTWARNGSSGVKP